MRDIEVSKVINLPPFNFEVKSSKFEIADPIWRMRIDFALSIFCLKNNNKLINNNNNNNYYYYCYYFYFIINCNKGQRKKQIIKEGTNKN